jgi:SAM-dependent methyltransferase
MNKRQFRAIIDSYKPMNLEISTFPSHFKGVHWLQISAYRYFRMINFLETVGSSSDVIDLGCYPGTLLRLIRQLFPDMHIYGAGLGLTDELKESVPYAKLFEANLDPDIYFEKYHQTPPKVELPDESMDVVIATEIVEHLYNPMRMLAEGFRLLKKGGLMYITTNNVAQLPGIFKILRGDTSMDPELMYTTATIEQKHDWRGHVRFWSGRELREMFLKSGFADVKVNYFTAQTWYKIQKMVFARIVFQRLRMLINNRYASNIECIARKP